MFLLMILQLNFCYRQMLSTFLVLAQDAIQAALKDYQKKQKNPSAKPAN